MSISIDGYSPVYQATPSVPEPQPAQDQAAADALAALQEAIAAAKRALEAARKAEEAARKAEEAAEKAKGTSQYDTLKGASEAKKTEAEQRWADVKVANKAAYAAGDPKKPDEVTKQLKAIDGNDEGWAKRVDEAKGEKPDMAIAASGNQDVDAAAKRVSGAYTSGGEAGATKQLRTELESAKTPEDRRAILRSAMPVVDKVTKDLGTNARHGDNEPWTACTPEMAKQGLIDTRSEFDHTVADLEASVELAGDKEAAFHIAHDILQVMPGGERANSPNNLLGLLGQDLGQSSPTKTSMLETALSAALVQPDAKGAKDSMLAMPLEQRAQAARLLAPDRPVTVTIRDWTDDKGVKHDGTLWHEVEQNPDLLLSTQQRADIDKKTKGLPAVEVLKEKTSQAIENLRQQNPDKNVDNPRLGDTFSYKAEDLRKNLPEPLAEDVQKAVDESKGTHQGDLQYGVDLDKLTNSDAFRKLGTDQQAAAIGQLDRTITQSARGGKPLDENHKNQLRELIGSSTFHDVNPRVQDRVLGMFAEFANDKTDARLGGLKGLIGHASFRALDDEAIEIQVLEGYQHDALFRGSVEKLIARTDLQPADARTTLDQLSRVQGNRQLYERSNDGDKQKILDAVTQATTDPRFLGFNQVQRDQTIDQLVKDDGLHFALRGKEGLDKAFEIGAGAKPPVTTPQPEPGPAPKAPGTKEPEPTPSPTTKPSDVAAKPQEPAAPPKDTPPTATSVTADLSKTQSGAHDVATSKETINDPLRRDAGEDPIRYAYLKLQDQHKDDKAYLKLLDEAMPKHRRDFTTQQVNDLVAKDKRDDALDLLTTQLNETKDPAERKRLWEAAGQPNFSRGYFDQQLDKVLNSDSLKKNEELAPLFNQIGEHAPPEAANLLLDAVKARIDKGAENPMSHTLMIDVGLGGQSYAGMTRLVERADSLGANRADEFGKFYVKTINEAMSDPQKRPMVSSLVTGVSPGLFPQVKTMAGEHGAAKLSISLYNELKAFQGEPMNWSDGLQSGVGMSLRNGIEEFRETVKDDVTDWQGQNKNALRLVQDYGGLDPDGVARAMTQDRKDHPFTYYHLDEDGNPAGVDAALAKMEQRGVQLDGLMRNLLKIKVDFDKPANTGEKMLGESIKGLDGDPLVMSTQKGNAALDEHRADQINYGHFAPADSPWNPTVIVGVQRDHLDKIVRDNGISPELTTKINERTDSWETGLQDELAKGDKADNAKLQSLTESYQNDLKELLKGKVADGGEGAMVKPPPEIVEHIKTTLQSAGTTTSTLRLTMNWYRDTGDSLLRAYTQVAFRRGLEGKGSFNTADDLVRNAARLGLSDEKSVNKAFEFMKQMQAKIDAKLSPDKPRLTAAERESLIADFQREAAQYGPAKGYDPKALPEAMKTSELVTRRLGMLCFLGSAVNNGVNAADEPGFTSSDLFAGLFGSGAVIEAYRSNKGLEMQGGKLQQLFEKRGMGANGAEQLSKYVKSNALGGLIAFADAAWAYEDFTGMTIGGKKAGEGDTTAGLLTTGIVMADLLELGAAGWRARLGTMAVAEGATIAGSSAAPVVGWVAAGLQAAFLGARFAYGVTKEKNKFEFEDNKDYANMVKSLGFTEHQARELMNQSGGNSDVKVKDWEWFIPGWNSYQSFHTIFGEGESFFQEGGMGPMHVLDPLFDANEVPQAQRLQYLQSLSPDEIQQLVGKTHKILDDEMDDEGKISDESLAGLKKSMNDSQLWKSEYLG